MSGQEYKTVKTSRGYIQRIWTDPETGKLRREYEHRIVWEEHFGPIPPNHHVHHIDGDKTNNIISNLELKPTGAHIKDHGDDLNWAWKRRKK